MIKRVLFTIALAFSMMGCVSTDSVQEEKIVTVTEVEYIKGVPVVHPKRPNAIKGYDGSPDITVLTPETLQGHYVKVIDSSSLTEKDKLAALILIDELTALMMDDDPFVYIGLSKNEYFKWASSISDTKRWIKVTTENLNYYESKDLYVQPED